MSDLGVDSFRNPDGLMAAIVAASEHLKPPEKLLPSEWAEKNISIPIGNAIPGPIRFDNAPYQIEPLNMTVNPLCSKITLMWGAQTGKTQLINCAIGYNIDHDPNSQIMMQPSQGDLHTWLETKFNPMVDANESLQRRIAKPRSREGVNNQNMKSYIGGFLMFAWAGSPKTMRGRSAPKIYCDETDGYDVIKEGHPVSLLWQRAATFGDLRQLIETSTPTIKGASHVEDSYNDGDRRKFHIPCPHCGEKQELKWKNVLWDKDAEGNHLPDTATYMCEHCGATISDGEKRAALRKGEWVAEKKFTGHASYHISELYSAFRKWSDIVTSFLEKKAANDLQSFVNVSLAETWEVTGEQGDPDSLITFAENYDRDSLHDDILMLTAGADVQKDRVEVQVVGWGYGGIPFIVAHDVFYGDPMGREVWVEVDQYLKLSFGGKRIAQALIDSGYLTEYVYKFTKPRHGRRIFPCKGEAGAKEIVNKPRQSGAQRAMLVKIGIDGVKRTLLTMLKSPGDMIHFSSELDEEFYKQLTAEKMIIKKVKGFDRIEFVKTRDRNEALDCFVYAYAAMIGLNPDWEAIRVGIEKRQVTDDTAGDDEIVEEIPEVRRRPQRKQHKKSGFVKRY